MVPNLSKGEGRSPKVERVETEWDAQHQSLAHSQEVGSSSSESVLLLSDDKSRLRKKSDGGDPDLDLDLVLHFCTSHFCTMMHGQPP